MSSNARVDVLILRNVLADEGRDWVVNVVLALGHSNSVSSWEVEKFGIRPSDRHLGKHNSGRDHEPYGVDAKGWDEASVQVFVSAWRRARLRPCYFHLRKARRSPSSRGECLVEHVRPSRKTGDRKETVSLLPTLFFSSDVLESTIQAYQ